MIHVLKQGLSFNGLTELSELKIGDHLLLPISSKFLKENGLGIDNPKETFLIVGRLYAKNKISNRQFYELREILIYPAYLNLIKELEEILVGQYGDKVRLRLDAWAKVGEATFATLPKDSSDLQSMLYKDDKFNIETIAVVLRYYRIEYGFESGLDPESLKQVVGRYNAETPEYQRNYSSKVFEYLPPIRKFLWYR